MKPLRILAALQYYLPHRTGYSLHVERVARGLVARGHAVRVLTARHREDLPARETLDGVEVRRLAAPIRVSRGALMPGYPAAAWALARACDVVWIHSPMAECAPWAVLARLAGVRLVATHHGDLVLPGSALDRAITAVAYAGWRYAAAHADAIVGYSDDYADASRWLAPWRAKLRVIPPPIEIPRPDRTAVARLRARLVPGGGPLVGFAGRFVREKRPDLLVDAGERLRARRPGLVLAFAGETRLGYEDSYAPLARRIEAAGDAIRILGPLGDAQSMADFYAALDLLVLPSDTECYGLVQAEAMLCGTPVVATDIPGARVPVRATGAGRLFERGSAVSLADAIDAVLGDPARYRPDPARTGRAFDLVTTLDRYEDVLRGDA